MEPFKKTDVRMRYILCAVILALSLLLLGAGRFREDLTNRRAQTLKTKEACREAVMGLKNGIAGKDRKAWAELVKANPELFVRVCSTGMKVQ
ncbi:MAG: hypothetical protein ACI4UV_10675 [Victivallales bacterium]